MTILNCDGLSQFYFGQPTGFFFVWGGKFEGDDNTHYITRVVNTSRGESRTITNSVVLLIWKRNNELSDNNFGAQTGVDLLSQHPFL